MIMASILKARGFEHIVNVLGGWKAIEAVAELPKSEYLCPTTLAQEVIDAAVEAVI